MRRTTIVIIGVVVLAVLGLLYFTVKQQSVSRVDTVVVPNKTADVVEAIYPKSVNGRAIVTEKYFEPSVITLDRMDTLKLYLTARANLTIVVPSDGRKYNLKPGDTQLIGILVDQNLTLRCVECADDAILRINVR